MIKNLRGEVASQGKPSSAEGLPTTDDIGLTHKDIHAINIQRYLDRAGLIPVGAPRRDAASWEWDVMCPADSRLGAATIVWRSENERVH